MVAPPKQQRDINDALDSLMPDYPMSSKATKQDVITSAVGITALAVYAFYGLWNEALSAKIVVYIGFILVILVLLIRGHLRLLRQYRNGEEIQRYWNPVFFKKKGSK